MCDLGRQLYQAFFPQGKYFNEGWDSATSQYIYTDKEYVSITHAYRGMIKDSVPACDRNYPLLYDTAATPPKVGHFTAETDVFNAIVGTNWTLNEMHVAADRALNIQRAIMLRQGRTRADDESIIPYFQYQKDNWPNDNGPQTLDPEKFRALLSRFYSVRGWDKEGRPTRATLEKLGLKDVADDLAKLGKLGS
jgi:aldehyde:ferredoxin oxidoreductase